MQNQIGNQCIHCTVGSCRFNAQSKNVCSLDSIQVCPSKQVSSGQTDESMCESYKKR